jgi:diguanylate cyclase (GGDEF)-like protein
MQAILRCILIFSIVILFPLKVWASGSHLIVQLPWDHQFQFAGFYQALWQGYYNEAGIEVEIRSGFNDEGKVINAIDAIASGKADIAPLDGLSLLIAQDQGANIVALAPILQQTPWTFHSLKEKPLDTLSDLAKASVAVSPDSIYIYKMLLQYKLLAPNPRLKAHVPPTIDSLVSGVVEVISGYAGSTIWLAKQQNIPINTLYAENYGIDFYADVISVNRDKLRHNPVLVEKFLQATLRGWEYALNNKEKTIKKIVSTYPRKFQVTDIMGLNHHFASHFQQLSRYPQVPLGNNDPERWAHMHDALKKIGMVSGNFDMMRQLSTPASTNESQYDWLLITLLFSSLAAVTLLAGWPGQRHLGYLAPLISVIFILIILYFAVALYREQEMENQKKETLIKLSTVRVQLEESITSTFFLLKGLITHIRLNPGLTQTEFEQISQQLIDDQPKINNIAAAPDLIVRMVYPLEDNQQVMNLDYHQLPAQWPSVLKAKESDQAVLSGPVQLVQGGVGLIGRLPIYIQDISGQRKFWGIVSTVMHVDAFYRAAGLYDASLGLEFAIRGKNGMGDRGEVFFGNGELFSHDRSVLMDMMIPGGRWQIAAKPTGDLTAFSEPVLFIYLLGSISIILAIISFYIRRSHEYRWRKNESYISYLAYHDSLTGLPNRTQFTEELDRVLAHAKRSGKAIAVLMLDLDHFKQINDTLGHAAGDEILIEVSRRLKKRIRKEDHIARLGGDEFVIIQRDLKTTDDAVTFAHELIVSLSQPYDIKQTRFISGASIGIAIWHPREKVDANLLEEADIALYKAKNKDRGSYAFHTSEMTREIQRRVDLRCELEKALNTNELSLVYQPQIDVNNNKLIGTEALLRWKHPIHGHISPAEFIPIAESHGMMHQLGFYVLKEACEALVRWRNEGFFQKVMAVNISPGQLNNEVFDKELIELMNRVGLPGDALELEVTEQVIIQPQANNGLILKVLATKGVKLAMDNFGTGYSSLPTLKHWPFHRLKIAQTFVRGMLTNPNDREIVMATIGLAENLGLQVIAEGVEKKEQMAFLKQNGCYLIQGYLLARPMPENKLLDWIHENHPNKLTTPSRPT